MPNADTGGHPYFAPYCRKGRHLPIAHHHRFGVVVGKECDCPCHLGNESAPWWSDIKADMTQNAEEPAVMRCPKCGSLDVECSEGKTHIHVCYECGYQQEWASHAH